MARRRVSGSPAPVSPTTQHKQENKQFTHVASTKMFSAQFALYGIFVCGAGRSKEVKRRDEWKEVASRECRVAREGRRKEINHRDPEDTEKDGRGVTEGGGLWKKGSCVGGESGLDVSSPYKSPFLVGA